MIDENASGPAERMGYRECRRCGAMRRPSELVAQSFNTAGVTGQPPNAPVLACIDVAWCTRQQSERSNSQEKNP